MRAASLTGTIPGEKTAVECVRALGAEGTAYDKLAAQLTVEGFRTRKGTAWHGYSVQRILARYVVVDLAFHTNPNSSSLRLQTANKRPTGQGALSPVHSSSTNRGCLL